MRRAKLVLLVSLCSACGPRAEPIKPVANEMTPAPGEKKADMPSLQDVLRAELEVVPGKAIGPLTLGMRADEVRALGVSLTPQPPSPPRVDVGKVGPVRIVLKEDVVVSIELEVAGTVGVRVAGKQLPIAGSLEEIAKHFPDCGKLELLEGGRMVRCGGGGTLLKQGSDDAAGVTIQVVPS